MYMVCLLCLVTQSCLTLCNPMDYSPPGSSVHGILLARILERVAMSFSRRLFSVGSDGKESTCNARELGWTPGSGRSPAEGNGYQLQYSCLENSMDRGAQQAIVHVVEKSQTELSEHFHFFSDNFNKRLYLKLDFNMTLTASKGTAIAV